MPNVDLRSIRGDLVSQLLGYVSLFHRIAIGNVSIYFYFSLKHVFIALVNHEKSSINCKDSVEEKSVLV